MAQSQVYCFPDWDFTTGDMFILNVRAEKIWLFQINCFINHTRPLDICSDFKHIREFPCQSSANNYCSDFWEREPFCRFSNFLLLRFQVSCSTKLTFFLNISAIGKWPWNRFCCHDASWGTAAILTIHLIDSGLILIKVSAIMFISLHVGSVAIDRTL